MYSLVKDLGIRRVVVEEAPYMIVALLAAEMFFKWGSFSLELIGFLATWAAASYVGNSLRERFG